jgi:hypothetical protein
MPLFFYVRKPRSTNQKNSIFKNAKKLARFREAAHKRTLYEAYTENLRRA